LFPFVVNGKDDLHWCAGYIIDVSDGNLCYVNLRIIDKVTLENLRNPTYAVITALNSPRSAPIEGIQPSVEQLSQKLRNKGTTGHKQIYITSLRAK